MTIFETIIVIFIIFLLMAILYFRSFRRKNDLTCSKAPPLEEDLEEYNERWRKDEYVENERKHEYSEKERLEKEIKEEKVKESSTAPVRKMEEVPVLLAVSAPEVVKPGDIFTVRLVAYIKSLEKKVKKELFDLSRGRSESYMGVESCRWKLNTYVIVKLSGKHLKVYPSECGFIWEGERNMVNFLVEVLADAAQGWTVLQFEVFIDGIRVAFIPLELEINSKIKSDKKNIVSIESAHTAFASYSSLDKARVLDRLASVRISAGLDIFMDCLSLHPGEEWKPRLEQEIGVRDIFLLFWSKNALNSEWVTWEWKKALSQKDESTIQLHPLQTVSEAPPPEELEKFHFGDIYMIVRDALKKNNN